MHYSSLVSVCLLASTSLVAAFPNPGDGWRSQRRRTSCTNSPSSRDCWSDGYDVSSDTTTQWPTTGKTVSYNLELTNKNLSPDGTSKPMMVVNGQYPGPTIEANWGDTLSITVTNSLNNNGTSMHWHGLRQLNTNAMDGTNGVTECPLPPGESKTYTFQATEYGTSWYHSHHSVQYSDGVNGPIIIHGPTTANWDIDLGALPVTDYYYTPAFEQYDIVSHGQAPPTADNILINGTMTSSAGGSYAVTTLTPGKKHLLHLVNTGINEFLHVGLDGHSFTVVAADFVPIVPYNASSIVMGVGQRYDVIIDANQAVGNYWFRVAPGGGGCDGPLAPAQAGNTNSIFRYANATDANPTSTGTLATGCYDETVVPYVQKNVPSGAVPNDIALTFSDTTATGNLVQWLINGAAMKINWGKPTLGLVLDNASLNMTSNATSTGPLSNNVFEIGSSGTEWTFWVINNDVSGPPSLPHPIHLHGHDFSVLAQGSGAFSGDASSLTYTNPIRRDVAVLPAGGHLVLGFQTDNPGAWLMHCHIPFHISGGLGLQFVEQKANIASTDGGAYDSSTCSKWNSWASSDNYVEPDSGL